MSEYKPKHSRHPSPGELPAAMRGLTDKIEIVDSTEDSN